MSDSDSDGDYAPEHHSEPKPDNTPVAPEVKAPSAQVSRGDDGGPRRASAVAPNGAALVNLPEPKPKTKKPRATKAEMEARALATGTTLKVRKPRAPNSQNTEFQQSKLIADTLKEYSEMIIELKADNAAIRAELREALNNETLQQKKLIEKRLSETKMALSQYARR
jgi:hypothetical protein